MNHTHRLDRLSDLGASTPYQRLHICTLMGRLELPLDRITLMHRLPFERAGLVPREPGRQVDAVLCELNKGEAKRLADALIEQIGD
jgi:hypothetical protein